jgi:hypothetical protein
MAMAKILIGVCNSQNTVSADFFWSVIGQEDFVASPVFARAIHPWDAIRNNQLITWFLNTDCDYFVKMDVDQKYPRDYFKTMVPLIDEYKVIGPVIFDRLGDFVPLINWADGNGHFDFSNKSGIIEVPYLHSNCFFSRAALAALKPPYYEAYMTDDGMKRKNHVDITFMRKFPAAGFPVHVNLDVVVEHLAEVAVSKEFYDTWHRGCEKVL